jgi:hypothetical protein
MVLGYWCRSDLSGVPKITRVEGGWDTKERAVLEYIREIKESRIEFINRANRAMNKIVSCNRKIRMAQKL